MPPSLEFETPSAGGASLARGRFPNRTKLLPFPVALWYFGGIAGGFLVHAFFLQVVAEDAFITFQFARHLASGHGLVWNIGESPVEGYTNFSWLLLSALLTKGGFDVPRLAQVFGILSSLVTLVYTYRFGRVIFELPGRYALVPCLLLASSGPFAAWAASGMETNAFGMCVLTGCYYLARWVQRGSRRHFIWCMLLTTLATFTRPEGVLLFAVVAALGALRCARGTAHSWLGYGLMLLAYLIPVASYIIWRYSYFGFLLPNTFYAKTGGGVLQYARGAKYSALFALSFLIPLVPVFFLNVWEGGKEVRRLSGVKWIIQHARSYIGMHLCLVVCAAFLAYVVYVGGDYMAMYRFFVPVLPFVYLPLGPAVYQLFDRVGESRHKKALTTGVVACSVGLTILHSTPLEGRLFRKPAFMHGTYQGIQTERWHVARYKVIADFFRRYRRSAEDSLALGPIGVIAYYADMKIHSFYGIVDPYIAHKQVPRLGRGLPGHEKYDVPYVLSKRPTFVMFSAALRQEPEGYPQFSDGADRTIRENYQLRSVWLVDDVNSEAGYFTFLELNTN